MGTRIPPRPNRFPIDRGKALLILLPFLLLAAAFAAEGQTAPAWVRDGTGADLDLTTNNSSHSANWAASDFGGAGSGDTLRYQYVLQENDGGWGDVDGPYNLDALYPATPPTHFTRSASLGDGLYRIRVRSGYGSAVGWTYSPSYTNSDGFIVDSTPPTAGVDPWSPPIQTTNTINVSWSGSDDPGGGVDYFSGVDSYDLQYRQGNGAWTAWVTDTSQTQKSFTANASDTYSFRVRARDIAGNVGPYSSPESVAINALSPALSLDTMPSALSFSAAESARPLQIEVQVVAAASVTLTTLQEERLYPNWGTEQGPPTGISLTVPGGQTRTLDHVVGLDSLQRSHALGNSTQGSFTLSIRLSGQDNLGSPVEGMVSIPVSVSGGMPSGFAVQSLTVQLPSSPYYIADIVIGKIVVQASGTGTVQGQVLVDEESDWTGDPSFTASLQNGTNQINIADNLPTGSTGEHTVRVELTSPQTLSAEATYEVSEDTPPFPPQTLPLIKDVAELSDFDGQAIVRSDPSAGYQEFSFTGTADLKLLSLEDTVLQEVTVTDLIVRYENDNPTKAKIRGGTVEKEAEGENYFVAVAKEYLRIKKVRYYQDKPTPPDYLTVDAKLYIPKIDRELMNLETLIVKTDGVEGKGFSWSENDPKKFSAWGMEFRLHDVDVSANALIVGKDAEGYYFSLSGSITMSEKKGTSTSQKKLTTFRDLTFHTNGDVDGTVTFKYEVVKDKFSFTKIQIKSEGDTLKFKLAGEVKNLPSPLNKLGTQEFEISFDKDGNAEGLITPLKELQKNQQGHKLGSSDATEWDIALGTLDITYLSVFTVFDEGQFNKDSSEIRLGLDLYINLKNQDGSEPSGDEKRISFGELNANEDFEGGVRLSMDGDFTWHQPTNAVVLQNKKLDLAALTIMIDALGVVPDPLSLLFTGSIVVDLEGVSGGVEFENLVIGLEDAHVSNLSESITGGSIEIVDVLIAEIEDVNWSNEPSTLNFRSNATAGEGENQSPQIDEQNSIEVLSYVQLLGASLNVGSKNNPALSGGFEEFTIYQPVNGSRSFVIREASLVTSSVELYADIEYSESLLRVAGGMIIPGGIEAAAVGKFGSQQGEFTMGVFVAASGLNIPVAPGLYLDEVGGGVFINPLPEDIALVHHIASFERPELEDTITDKRPGGAQNPGSFALMLLGGFYVGDRTVLNGRALLTITANYFELDIEAECVEGLVEGTGYLTVSWSPAFAEGNVEFEMDYLSILEGEGHLGFYVYGQDTWGVNGSINVSLLGSKLASGSLFVGPPGFMVEASVKTGVDIYVVSGSLTYSGMFWFNRGASPPSWGAYASVAAEGEFLKGLLSASAKLEGALIGAPRFVIYAVGSVNFKVCYVTVFKGSLWVSAGVDGLDGVTGRNGTYDALIDEARNMADQMNQAKEELLEDIDNARLAALQLSEEQLEAAGIVLVERGAYMDTLEAELHFNSTEVPFWNQLPYELAAVHE